ncbi:hypothetical protein COM37_06470, partial [Bacillus toyonensis]
CHSRLLSAKSDSRNRLFSSSESHLADYTIDFRQVLRNILFLKIFFELAHLILVHIDEPIIE